MTEEERAKVVMQVEHFITILSQRYGIEPTEVVEAVKWVQAHKLSTERLQQAGIKSILSIVLTALALSIWEGARSFLWKR
jgi:hypothetical protein